MSNFEIYPRYHLDKYGQEIQNILNHASKYFGMAADTRQDGKDVPPNLKKVIGGAEHLVKGIATLAENEQSSGAKIFFQDQLESQPEAGIVNIYLDHRNEQADPQPIPLAVGHYASADDITELFIPTEIVDAPSQLATPFAIFTPKGADYKKIIVCDRLLNPDNSTFEFNITTTKASGTETVTIYDSNLPIALLESLLDNSELGYQVIKIVNLGDDTTCTDSAEFVLYRLSLGKPIINDELTGEYYTTFKLAIPDTTVFPEDFKIKLAITPEGYVYNYETGVRSPLNVLNAATGATVGVPIGGCCTAWLNLDPNNAEFANSVIKQFTYLTPLCDDCTEELEGDAVETPSSDLVAGNAVVAPSKKVVITNYKKLLTPIEPVINPMNGLAYCFYSSLAGGTDVLPSDLRFVYKIERPDLDASNDLTYITIAEGETSPIDVEQPLTPEVFFLRIGDKLTIKARAAYYEDSNEISVVRTGTEVIPIEGIPELADERIEVVSVINFDDLENDEVFKTNRWGFVWGEDQIDIVEPTQVMTYRLAKPAAEEPTAESVRFSDEWVQEKITSKTDDTKFLDLLKDNKMATDAWILENITNKPAIDPETCVKCGQEIADDTEE
jgi:hypothetical protein